MHEFDALLSQCHRRPRTCALAIDEETQRVDVTSAVLVVAVPVRRIVPESVGAAAASTLALAVAAKSSLLISLALSAAAALPPVLVLVVPLLPISFAFTVVAWTLILPVPLLPTDRTPRELLLPLLAAFALAALALQTEELQLVGRDHGISVVVVPDFRDVLIGVLLLPCWLLFPPGITRVDNAHVHRLRARIVVPGVLLQPVPERLQLDLVDVDL